MTIPGTGVEEIHSQFRRSVRIREDMNRESGIGLFCTIGRFTRNWEGGARRYCTRKKSGICCTERLGDEEPDIPRG